MQGTVRTTGSLPVLLYLLPHLDVEGWSIFPKRLSYFGGFQTVSTTWELGKETRILFAFPWWYLGKFR